MQRKDIHKFLIGNIWQYCMNEISQATVCSECVSV